MQLTNGILISGKPVAVPFLSGEWAVSITSLHKIAKFRPSAPSGPYGIISNHLLVISVIL